MKNVSAWRAALRRIPLSVRALLLLAVLVAPVLAGAAIRADRWLADVRFLASDALKGRGNGAPELDQAADYIAEQFRKAGLEAPGGNYFQPFEAIVGADLGPDNRLVFAGPPRRAYRLHEDFIPLSLSGSGERSEGLVFAGYGITAPEYEYDDYAGIDVTGKIVVVLRHEPQEDDEDSVFRGRRFTRHAGLVNKAINARNRGALALVVVNDPLHHRGREDRLIRFGEAGGPSDLNLPFLQVKQTVAEQWFEEAGRSMTGLQKSIDGDLSNHSFVFPDAIRLEIRADVSPRRARLKNVAGYLPGSDPRLKDEIIVIGAHYDHLGLGGEGSLSPSQTGSIHHGADDNASGTAGMMELARSFAAEKGKFRRSLLFLAFAGEEMGLLGSAHYVKEPLLRLQNTVAMLNLDMIGRVRGRKLYIGGVGTSPGFRKLVEEVNGNPGFQLEFSDSGYDASDHMSFNSKEIPVLFFFSGLHSDYHKPSDTWEKVEPEETARLLELAGRVAQRIDAGEERPAFVRVERPQRRRGGEGGEKEAGYGPYFGSIPDFGESTQGVKFADVREGGPAASAGLKGGDILVEFDGQPVNTLYDFTYLLRGKRPDDEVRVVVLRGEERVEAVVKLGRRE